MLCVLDVVFAHTRAIMLAAIMLVTVTVTTPRVRLLNRFAFLLLNERQRCV